MTLAENIEKRIQHLEDNMTLKVDYSEELEELNGIESDIAVAKYMNGNRFKLNESLKNVNRIRTWIKEETA